MLSESIGIEWANVPLCSSCHKPWSKNFTFCSKLIHLRQCGQSRGKSSEEIIQIVKGLRVTAIQQCDTTPAIASHKTCNNSNETADYNQESTDILPSKNSFHNQTLKPTYTNSHESKIPTKLEDTPFSTKMSKKCTKHSETESIKKRFIDSSGIVVIDISSDDDFVAEKFHQKKKITKSFVTNLNIGKALSLSLNSNSTPLEFAEIISKRRKKIEMTPPLLIGSPAKAYTDSKIRSLKFFSQTQETGDFAPRVKKESEGLRDLSILPLDPFSLFFQPFKNEIEIVHNISSTDTEILGFHIEVEYKSRADQTMKYYTSKIKTLEEEMAYCLQSIEKEKMSKAKRALIISTIESQHLYNSLEKSNTKSPIDSSQNAIVNENQLKKTEFVH